VKLSTRLRLDDGGVVSVRSATPRDGAALADLNRCILEETNFHIREGAEYAADADTERRFIETVARQNGSLYLVVEALKGPGGEALGHGSKSRMLGLLLFQRERLRRLRHGGNLGLAVLKSEQRRGIGMALMDVFLDWCSGQQGLRRVKLEVFETNRVAIRLYEGLGFSYEGVRRGEVHVGDDWVDLILMAKSLDQD
jgi:RimJ/RimL family protein N-acetyltransferase